jgi:glutathione S-transferase
MIRLYFDPASTSSRPVILFAADAGIDLDHAPINLMTADNQQPWFARLNPNKAVPVLQDGDFVLTESSAILKYLAEAHDATAYPKDPKQRARVNERMDWFATFFRHDVNYGLCYPEVLPKYRMSESAQGELAAYYRPRALARFDVLDAWLAETPYVCGESITLADYLGVCFATLTELIHMDLLAWPNVQRWIAAMKNRPAWDETQCAFYGWLNAIDSAAAARRLSA